MEYGLIGGRLGHSYSKPIHEALAGYDYRLCPLPTPEEAHAFMRARDFKAINVTIPYKELVMPYCDVIDDAARAIGSVNTIVNKNGRLEGHNTDFAGFTCLLRRNGISLRGKTVMLLGTGGTQKTVLAVARAEGAAQAVLVSRRRAGNAITYEEAARRADVQVIVNTSPVGMYPNNGECLVALENYPRLEAVLDVIYNPFRTALLQQAEARGLPAVNGMLMLVAQAKYAAEHFLGRPLPDAEIDRIDRELRGKLSNLVLVGMPGSGKRTIAALLAVRLHRPVLDSDAQVVETACMSIPDIFAAGGEAAFRARETAALAELGKRSGAVLATGGGSICREENYPLLHQNGTIFWLQRDLALLPKDGRPISQRSDLAALYAQRAPLYARFADAVIDNNGTPEETVRKILEVLA